jgi:hydroxymethylbilane synthase
MENKKIEVEKLFNARMEKIRFYCAQEILDNGGVELMKTIKINLKK